MKHEIGHNQGAHHDRQTVVGGSNGAYNYGYRRCSNGNAPSGLSALASALVGHAAVPSLICLAMVTSGQFLPAGVDAEYK